MDDATLRYPFRRVKGKFLNLGSGQIPLLPVDKRYILHICHRRFSIMSEEKKRDHTFELLQRYQIPHRNIKNWLKSKVLMDNINDVGDVPAMLPPFLPRQCDGKFDENVQQHAQFNMDYIVRYFIDYNEVLLLSYGVMEAWYGIPHSTLEFFVKIMKKNSQARPKTTLLKEGQTLTKPINNQRSKPTDKKKIKKAKHINIVSANAETTTDFEGKKNHSSCLLSLCLSSLTGWHWSLNDFGC